MAETLTVDPNASRAARYAQLNQQWRALFGDEPNRMANLANVTAALHSTFGWHWVGFYVVDVQRDQLVLGPFQGPLACTRLFHGKGVCAAAWDEEVVQIVPDVHAFPGHVACSALTQSELVLPVFSEGCVVAVLDIDSVVPGDFSEADVLGLESLMHLLSERWAKWE